MDIDKLRTALQEMHPTTGLPYTDSADLDRDMYRIADVAAEAEINTQNVVIVVEGEVRINELDIMGAFETPQEGEAVLQKIETAALQDAALARSIKFIRADSIGIDITHPAVRATIKSLVTATVLTQGECDTVCGLGEQTTSVAEIECGGYAKLGFIEEARGRVFQHLRNENGLAIDALGELI